MAYSGYTAAILAGRTPPIPPRLVSGALLVVVLAGLAGSVQWQAVRWKKPDFPSIDVPAAVRRECGERHLDLRRMGMYLASARPHGAPRGTTLQGCLP